MGFRFRRSVRILPGVKINLSGRGASVSLGARGFHYTIGPKGTRVTAGIPGTGLSWTQYTPYANTRPNVQGILPPPLDFHPDEQQSHVELEAIQNASAGEINALSTSQLAPILNSARHKFRLSPAIQIFCVLLFAAALLQTNQLWIGTSALYATIFVPFAIFLDRYRRSAKVIFEPNGLVAKIVEALGVAFTELTHCETVWMVHAEGRTTDWKRNAGATSLNTRRKTKLQFGRPHCIRGKAAFPSFKLGSDELYLLPDAALIILKGAVAAISYRDLEFSNYLVKYIEEERVPSDTKIVEHTWRYVNKSGGPDRRFINNTQLPVCIYGEMAFRSEGGLNCKFQLSNPSAADSLHKVVEALRRTTVELPKSVTYISKAKHWPTIAFLSCAVIFGLGQLALLQKGILLRNPGDAYWIRSSNTSAPASTPASPPTDGTTKASGDISPPSQSLSPPLQLKPPSLSADFDRTTTVDAENSQELRNLNDAENVRWVQSRLRELGFLRGDSVNWDSFSRSALRDFKASNNLGGDEKWDYKTQQLLASASALRVEQTFVGSWSEAPCDPRSKPDIFINSRRATSSAGGICEFSNVRAAGSGWTVGTACSNVGEKWTATIHLTVSSGKLVWTGRDGTETQYFRCR